MQEKIAISHPGEFGFNNMAMSGDRVTDVWLRLCSEAIPRFPNVVLIAVGSNDTIRWESPDAPMDISQGLRREMWSNILSTAKKNFDKTIICGMTPVLEDKFPENGAYNTLLYHRNVDIDAYNKDIEEWSKEHSLPFLPLKEAWSGHKTEDLIFDAGHPNGKGHELIASFVYDKLKELHIYG